MSIDHGARLKERLKELTAKHYSNIEKYGLSVQCVGGGDDGFAYTIGMVKHGLPDAIITCADPRAAKMILNLYYEYVTDEGMFYGRNTDLIAGKDGSVLPVYVKPLDGGGELVDYVVQALNVYQAYPQLLKGKIEFVQLMLPDVNGLLPFDEGYSQETMPQPILKGSMIS